MSRNVRCFACTPDDVFAALSDGWLYPTWVVGASRMREVEPQWPQPGSRLHHSFGVWPALINDTTVSLMWDPPYQMVMRARGWPIGEAQVTIDVRSLDEEHCMVRIQEQAVRGPARLLPRGVRDLLLHTRNAETIERLAFVAEGRRANGDAS
ncbi:SRPBCC family protein [Microbacterium sp. NPDC076911]|uniref:SRPBCC family protein n=1 Tax=Microbacterium sp. NPDC076911 TaxID=3154958 RepID=UPI00343C9079